MCPNFYSEETPCGSILGSDHLPSLTTAIWMRTRQNVIPVAGYQYFGPKLRGDIALLYTVNTR